LEIRVNLVLIAVLGCVWLGMRAHAPIRVTAESQVAHLSTLEDAFARDRTDARALAALTDAYLEAGLGALAIVTVRAAEPVLLEQPAVAHQLAKAYEHSGRLLDALATADLALSRCERVLGAGHVDDVVPHYDCSERTLAKLDMHKSALEKMVRWGIVDPRVDPRAQRAYELALRRARIAVNGDGLPRQTIH
jgi:hypothetical protein